MLILTKFKAIINMPCESHVTWFTRKPPRKGIIILPSVIPLKMILMTAVGARPKPEVCFFPGRLRWTLLLKERYGDWLSGCGSKSQPSNCEAELPSPKSNQYLSPNSNQTVVGIAESESSWRFARKYAARVQPGNCQFILWVAKREDQQFFFWQKKA